MSTQESLNTEVFRSNSILIINPRNRKYRKYQIVIWTQVFEEDEGKSLKRIRNFLLVDHFYEGDFSDCYNEHMMIKKVL